MALAIAGLVGVLSSLFLLVARLGFIAANATALALGTTDPQIAGSASGLLGMLQFSIGAVLAPLVGLCGTATAIPVSIGAVLAPLVGLCGTATAIPVFGIVAFLTFLVFCRPHRHDRMSSLRESRY